ncbi:cysteine hydrolase family protein [Paenibacillus macquariensis]|uniref:Isochorismatase family protein n=1 Tax=Paenibacillus macquariensis TaxID=948756 RepID=A0ABY1JK03_9BACL|nr:isochorismatase family protein [Paenibacillus macquariensis]MEC0089833.1 isochorismatase family protein [Paenibacillus macquariensis]OAB30700.1 hypothetical protein PMSM_21385 [Paenibacillus macquariensis subsp. macquariensis]SIQ32241.1 Isochorismatase family protein [Paenibacillus macquariensis]
MIGTHTALLIIDVQIGSFRESTPLYKGNELLKNLQLLISKAHVAQASIFFTKFNGKTGTLSIMFLVKLYYLLGDLQQEVIPDL